MDRTIIKGLNAFEYQHPFDRKALQLLRGTSGLSMVMKKISEYGIEAFTKMRLTGSGLRVTSSNFPAVYAILEEACKILDIAEIPELYLVRGDLFTTTIGVEKPIVALSHSTIDLFTEDELMFILGHQLSYIKSESVLYQQLAEALSLVAMLGTAGPMALITVPINIAIKRWEKMSKYTADRGGLLCCQDVEAATSAFVKLAGQPEKLYHQIDVDEFKRQAYDFGEFDLNNYNKIVKALIALDETHPPYVIRGAEFFKWIKSGEYENILLRKPVINIGNDAKCSFCGQRTIGDENFCTNCGNKVLRDESEHRCPNCNRAAGPDDKFCTNCGTGLQSLGDEEEGELGL
ncbi:MAG: M48 family metallopeptidase [Bacteroidia bacterium]